MHPLITSHRAAIDALCHQYGVRRLEMFGSVLRDDFEDATSDFDLVTSDFDLVVEFDPRAAGQGLRSYFRLKADLEALLARPVDLVELAGMENTRLKRLIGRSEVTLYAMPA